MRCRPVDEYGDMMPVSRKYDMLEGANAVQQAIRSRLGMLYGEWWEDETLGFQVPAFLMEKVQSNDVEMLVGYVAAYVLKTPGVSSLASQSYNLDGRDLTIDIAVQTPEGEIAEGSVDMYGLLSAAS